MPSIAVTLPHPSLVVMLEAVSSFPQVLVQAGGVVAPAAVLRCGSKARGPWPGHPGLGWAATLAVVQAEPTLTSLTRLAHRVDPYRKVS